MIPGKRRRGWVEQKEKWFMSNRDDSVFGQILYGFVRCRWLRYSDGYYEYGKRKYSAYSIDQNGISIHKSSGTTKKIKEIIKHIFKKIISEREYKWKNY